MEDPKENLLNRFPEMSENGQLQSGEAPSEAIRSILGRLKPWLAPLLFVVTLLTTLISGARISGVDPLRDPSGLIDGIPFAFTLMAILFVHEMGHYLTSKNYRVNTTPPFFIPGPWFPFGIGTFGAFIRMRAPILRKHALMDIGAAGPIAGFVVAFAAAVIGLQASSVIEPDGIRHGWVLGDPLLFAFLADLLLEVPEGYDVILHPIALAGWFGFFVTSLNLLPIGQLDGGHIAYALLGKWQQSVSVSMVLVLVVLGFYGWPGWYLWAFLVSILGVRHPPTLDEEIPLHLRHKVVGWASAALFVLTFIPVPMTFR